MPGASPGRRTSCRVCPARHRAWYATCRRPKQPVRYSQLARLRRLTIVAGTALLFAVPSGAADWPRYGGGDLATNHVPASAAAGLSSQTVRDILTHWTVNVGGRFVASPLYAETVAFGNARENAIFVATNAGTVAALRAADGTVLWKRQVSAATRIPACGITYGIS